MVKAAGIESGKAGDAVAVVISLAAVAVMVWRVFYGVDFIDEAYYAAESYRFALGARPFIDLIDVHQMASLLTAPYVWLHLRVFGDTTGIMLSLRLLWVLLDATAAVLWFILLSRHVDRRLAVLACAAGFSFVPYMIPAPSFNTLPVLFGSAGLALIGLGLIPSPRAVPLVLAGVCLGIATVAYPTVAIAAFFALSGVWWLTRSWREPALVGAGGLAVALIGAAFLMPYASGVPTVIRVSSQMAPLFDWLGAGGFGYKVWQVLTVEAAWAATHLSMYLAIAAGVLSWRGKRVPWWLLAALVASLPLAIPSVVDRVDTRGMMIAMSILVAAAAAVLPARGEGGRDVEFGRFIRFALVYGLVSAFVFALTSSRGFLLLGLGAITVMPAAVAVLLDLLADRMRDQNRADIAGFVSASMASVLVVGLMYYNVTGYYRDVPPLAATTRVTSGPHRGLLTSKENAESTEGLWAAVGRLSRPDDRLLSYHGFPAGYLYTPAEPSLPYIWIGPSDAMGFPSITKDEITALRDPAHRPTIVIRNLGLPSEWVFQMQNPSGYDPKRDGIEAFVRANYVVSERGKGWQILVPAR